MNRFSSFFFFSFFFLDLSLQPQSASVRLRTVNARLADIDREITKLQAERDKYALLHFFSCLDSFLSFPFSF